MKTEEQELQDIIEREEVLSMAEVTRIFSDPQAEKKYLAEHPKSLYSMLMLALTHKGYPEKDAQKFWFGIVQHHQLISQKLGRKVGVSVATLDYLTNIHNEISEPKIIEETKSEIITRAATEDELSTLYLREVFDITLSKEFDMAKRLSTTLSLLMIDIDDFKKVNDQYGHLKGDNVIHEVGKSIKSEVREMDTAARYGGEEFSVIMPNTNNAEAYRVAERIRQRIESLTVNFLSVTVSIGVSTIKEQTHVPEELVVAADKALYRAKGNGKNQVQLEAAPAESQITN